MQQMFPCPRCGQQNIVGQQFCGSCGEYFQYNCPNCNAIVNATLSTCPYCNTALYWPSQQSAPLAAESSTDYDRHMQHGDYHQKPASKKTSSIQLIILGILAAAVCITILVFVFDIFPRSTTKSTSNTDSTAPVLSDISTSSITETNCTISWSTNVPATTQVEYGTSTNYGSVSPLDEELVTNHSVNLSGLNPDTKYHFRVKSEDANGNMAASYKDKTFTTLAAVDSTPPIISGISANVTTSTATVQWTTNEPSTSQVEYGTTTSYGSTSSQDDEMVSNHSVSITDLESNTKYHFRVRSKDSTGNEAMSGSQSFTTIELPDTEPPVISNVTATITTDNVTGNFTVTITWTTDELSTSQIEYGTTTAYGSLTTLDEDLVTSHSVDLTDTDLAPNTSYHYRVKSKDEEGNEAGGNDMQLYTPSTS